MTVANPIPGTDWSGPGPILGADFLAEIHGLLKGVDDLEPGLDLPRVSDYPSACTAIDVAFSGLDLPPTGLATAWDARATELAHVMCALHRARRRLDELQARRVAGGAAALSRVVDRLEASAESVQDLLLAAPELVCELGFDRGLLSRIENDVWHAELAFYGNDPNWAEDVVEAGRSMPQPLIESLQETTMVRTRRPILVTGVRFSDDGRWGNQVMVEASHTRSYVAAPILSGRRVIGLLHADCYEQRRDVDEVDRDLLWAFTQVLSLALGRAVLHDRMLATAEALGGGSGIAESVTTPVIRLDRPDGLAPDELLIRTGQRPRSVDPLIESLTPRELEVLQLMAEGCTNTAIARDLGIAEDTAKQHVKHILRKLHAGNRSGAVARYFQTGAGQP